MSMRADGLLKLEKQPYPFGPRLAPSETGQALKTTYPKTLRKRRNAINFVADHLGKKDVNQLERLATALYVTRDNEGASPQARASEIHNLKPHVSIESGLRAVDELDEMLEAAEQPQAA